MTQGMAEGTKVRVQVSRRYDAPPERVFDAWLDVERARKWLFATPEGEMVAAEIDPRVGGAFRFTDRRGGEDVEHVGEYLEIDRPRRLVFRFGVPALSPERDRVTIEIEPRDGGCELTLTHETGAEWAEGAEKAWSLMLEAIGRSLAGDGAATPGADDWGVAPDATSLRFERLLPGPIERVWAYLTESDERARWLAAGDTEPRVGGRVDFRFRHADLSPVPGEIPERYRQYENGATSTGQVTVWEPPRRLAFTWDEEAHGVSEVHFDLSPAGDRVRLVLTHRRIADRTELIGAAGGWHTHLAILRDHLEGRTPPNFWALHEGLEDEYARRLAE